MYRTSNQAVVLIRFIRIIRIRAFIVSIWTQTLATLPKEGVAKSLKALNHEGHEGHKGKEKLFFVFFVSFVVTFFSEPFATPSKGCINWLSIAIRSAGVKGQPVTGTWRMKSG